MPVFSEEICPAIEEYDDHSMDQEEMSETECDRDCIGMARQRKCKFQDFYCFVFSCYTRL